MLIIPIVTALTLVIRWTLIIIKISRDTTEQYEGEIKYSVDIIFFGARSTLLAREVRDTLPANSFLNLSMQPG